MIKDSPTSRSPATAMRDLLRQLERQTITPPARPNNPPPPLAPLAASAPLAGSQAAEPPLASVGAWVLAEDPVSGDLIASHPNGATHTLASKGDI